MGLALSWSDSSSINPPLLQAPHAEGLLPLPHYSNLHNYQDLWLATAPRLSVRGSYRSAVRGASIPSAEGCCGQTMDSSPGCPANSALQLNIFSHAQRQPDSSGVSGMHSWQGGWISGPAITHLHAQPTPVLKQQNLPFVRQGEDIHLSSTR